MSYSNSFPQQRPTLNLDFANSGKLDSRVSFSRADTPPTYAAPSAVHYWSNEKHLSSLNLTTNSEDFSAWSKTNSTATANTTAAPDGNTTASTMTGNAGTSLKYVQSNAIAVTDPVISVFAKAGTHSYIQISDNASSQEYANFDLANGTVGNVGTLVTAAIQAVGSTGWYRCLMRVTRTSSAFTWRVVMIDSSTAARQSTTSSTGTVHLWGGMMTELGDLTNVVAYQSSDSQIHREFAPTLKSVANAGDPRFEYSPTDGQSVGLLIESQATNLQRYGSAFNLWNTASNSTVSTSQAIAPNGALEANLFVPNSTPAAHFVNDSTAPLTSGTTYTGSVYIKSAGKRYAQLIGTSGAFGTVNYATFDLQTGSVDTTGVTASAQNVGNGWWRIIVSATANNTTNGGFFIAAAESATSTRNPSYAGNDYDGLLIWGFQIETGSSASSLANSGTSSSGVTRASDSCSVATSSFGFTGGPMSLVGEASGGLGAYPQLVRFRSSSSGEIASISKSSPSATDSTVYGWGMTAGGSDQGRVYAAATTGDFKLGAVADTNRLAIVANGNSPITDSSAALFDQLTVMDIGNNAGINQLNGHIKRLALYNVALSDTELQALTS